MKNDHPYQLTDADETLSELSNYGTEFTPIDSNQAHTSEYEKDINHLREIFTTKINSVDEKTKEIKVDLNDIKNDIKNIPSQISTAVKEFWTGFGVIMAIIIAIFIFLVPYLYNSENIKKTEAIEAQLPKIKEVEKRTAVIEAQLLKIEEVEKQKK